MPLYDYIGDNFTEECDKLNCLKNIPANTEDELRLSNVFLPIFNDIECEESYYANDTRLHYDNMLAKNPS